jgi:hypothetical protein
MTLTETLAALGEPATLREHFASQWDAAQAARPAGRPDFLCPEFIRTAWAYGSFEGPVPPELFAMADRMAADPALLAMGWYIRWRIVDGRHEPGQGAWPTLEAALGDDAGIPFLLAALATIPAVRAYHVTLRLPESVTRDTCRQAACFLLNYQRGHGQRPGIYTGQAGWLRNYLIPNLYFRIGRFEYWYRTQRQAVRVFRHRETRQVLALAPGDYPFTPAGLRCFAKDAPEPAGTWRSVYRETEAAYEGNPISPFGFALPRAVALPRRDWACVLQPGDAILDMHIPSGGGMPLASCLQSFRDAVAFFRQQFPDLPPARAIASTSWMFSDQLEQALPPDANLVQLLRELYLFPVACQPNDSLWFVFLQKTFNPATAPRETSLQRNMLAFHERGNDWHPSSMFVLPEDLPHIGTQHYRRQWPPTNVEGLA